MIHKVDDFDTRLMALILKNGNCDHMDCSACPMMDECLSQKLTKQEIVGVAYKWLTDHNITPEDLFPHLF